MEQELETLPAISGNFPYVRAGASLFRDLNEQANRNLPAEEHLTIVRDARPIRDSLDLDREGFVLVDYPSKHSGLRDVAALDIPYHAEHQPLIEQLSRADLVIPYRPFLQVRMSPRKTVAGVTDSEDNARPAPFPHADVNGKTFLTWTRDARQAEGVEIRPFQRAALYQTWRAVSEPPQDYPLALTDGRSVKPGNYGLMASVGDGRDEGIQTRMAFHDPDQLWYYFSNMTSDELLVFKGFDTHFGDLQSVWHVSFDTLPQVPDAKPRESIECRFLAFWF